MADSNINILHPAPVTVSMNVESNKMHDRWIKFFVNLNGVIKNFFPIRTIKSANGIVQTAVPSVTRLTTTERDNISNTNWQNGDIIYNTTTDKFNFREAGAWKELV